MTPDCNPRNCPGHEPMDTKVKVNNALMIVFGLSISVLLIWVLGTAQRSSDEISAHKDVAALRYSNVEREIAKLGGEINIANNNFEYVKTDMKDDINDLKELIKKHSNPFANVPLDTSALRFPGE